MFVSAGGSGCSEKYFSTALIYNVEPFMCSWINRTLPLLQKLKVKGKLSCVMICGEVLSCLPLISPDLILKHTVINNIDNISFFFFFFFFKYTCFMALYYGRGDNTQQRARGRVWTLGHCGEDTASAPLMQTLLTLFLYQCGLLPALFAEHRELVRIAHTLRVRRRMKCKSGMCRVPSLITHRPRAYLDATLMNL